MMRLSRLTDYAILLLTHMVSGNTSVWAACELANRSGVPAPTVAKILQLLAKSGIIDAHRGAAGGYRLCRSASEISIASVIEAIDGPIAITDCSDGGDQDCRIQHSCPMSAPWNKVNLAVRAALQSVSLADMQPPTPFTPAPRTIDVREPEIESPLVNT